LIKTYGEEKKIPGNAEWFGWKEDLDVKYAHKLLFGKSISEVIKHFDRSPIERADELLFMPRKAFQYYIFAFTEYLNSNDAIGASDAASPFLRLLIAREKRDPGSVMEIYEELFPTINFVAQNQARFDANPDIYGHFEDLARELDEAYKKYQGKGA
jgi:hypothetical protein